MHQGSMSKFATIMTHALTYLKTLIWSLLSYAKVAAPYNHWIQLASQHIAIVAEQVPGTQITSDAHPHGANH